MTLAFAVAGITQVYLERKAGMDFLLVQKELHPHFLGLVLAASLFAFGILAFIVQFFRYGMPVASPKARPQGSLSGSEALNP